MKAKLIKAEGDTVYAFITGLKNEQLYDISIVAKNDKAVSPPSNKEECRPHPTPSPSGDSPPAPKLNAVYPAKNSLVLDFDATEGEEALYYRGYAVGGGKTYTAEVFDPDEDMVIEGLTEGVEYACTVTATSQKQAVSDPSNEIKATCKTVIVAPVLKDAIAGDGKVQLVYDLITPPNPWTIDHYSFSAVNSDKPDEPEVEGHIGADGWIELANDINWAINICAVCNPGRVPGDFSNTLYVTPEKKSVPYPPNINTCYIQANGQIYTSWTKGTNGNHSQSAMTVDKWKVKYRSLDAKGKDFEQDCDANLTDYLSSKVTIGTWEVTVLAHNDMGWSNPSKGVSIDYKPSVKDPLVGGVTDEDDTYKYCIFYSNATTGYEALRTEDGINTTFEVLMVGAGGAGKGQTVTLGKGGDAGGGELVISTLPPAYAGSIFVTVPNGGKFQGDSPADTTVKEGSTILTARAGKTANDKNNAAGYPKTEVPQSWWKLRQFWWLEPLSHYVGGVAQSGEQNYPSATICGQGGAGTKESKAGNGGESYVAIRWKK